MLKYEANNTYKQDVRRGDHPPYFGPQNQLFTTEKPLSFNGRKAKQIVFQKLRKLAQTALQAKETRGETTP